MKRAHLPMLLAMFLVVPCGCHKAGDSAQKKSQPPANTANHADEQSLNTIRLTEKQQQRLGIRTAEVKLTEVQRRRKVGGEVVIPPGQTIIVSAPISGTLAPPETAPVPVPGSKLAMGQPVFRFTPLLTPERDVLTLADRVRVAQSKADIATAQIDAERQVESAKVSLEAAQIAYDRAVQLFNSKAGSRRSVDEAETQRKLAHQATLTAQVRYEFLSGIRLDEQAGELATRIIQSPVAGVLQSIDAAAGETVAAGDALFRVIKLDRVWIRASIYVGRWREFDTGEDASIAEYGQPSDAPARTAKYVSAPPSADPAATTVDLCYELANEDGRLYPGQKLELTLPMRSRRKSLVVPWSAILYDIHGETWVYEQVEARTYVRRRVAVDYVDGSLAILAADPTAAAKVAADKTAESFGAVHPKPGVKVVTDGAAELFGTEFGVGK